MNTSLLDIAKNYLKTLEESAARAELKTFFDPAVVQIEFPNRLTVNGAMRDLNALLAASDQGKKVLTAQKFEIQKEFVSDNTVIFEILWSGTLAIPVGKLAAGDIMKAHFATFIEFHNGKIIAQRNYDCFEPF